MSLELRLGGFRSALAIGGAVVVLLGFSSPASAAAGHLDRTFGGDGRIRTDFTPAADNANAVAIQADGRIVVAGIAGIGGANPTKFALARYKTDGSLDTSFARVGRVTTAFHGGGAFDVAIQANGKIVAVGASGFNGPNRTSFALARYKPNGSLDTTFGGDGKVTTAFVGFSSADAVAIQADGRIVVAGVSGEDHAHDPKFALARYRPDGTLDSSFSGDGKVTTNFSVFGDDRANGVAVQADGRIVAAGVYGGDPSGMFALARYKANGTLDPTFGGDGKVTTDFTAAQDRASDVAIQRDGAIVAAGIANERSDLNSKFALARYRRNGTLDPTFGGDGRVTTDFTPHLDGVMAVAIQATGRIVAAGTSAVDTSSDPRFTLARYATNGSRDTTFGGDGKVTTDFTPDTDGADGVAIQSNSKIVAAGESGTFGRSNPKFAVARYLST